MSRSAFDFRRGAGGSPDRLPAASVASHRLALRAACAFAARQGLPLLLAGLLTCGCAAVAPFAGLITSPLSSSPPGPQVHEETRVNLFRDNFVLVRTNVMGQSRGFSLFGLVTLSPATLMKALHRMYGQARMAPGEPQTVTHLIIEQSSSFWVLFSIPKVQVCADIVQFRPGAQGADAAKARSPPEPDWGDEPN